MNLKCCIIDADPSARSLLENYVQQTENLTLVGSFDSAISAVKTVMEGGIDIVFLDVELPYITGIEFAQIVRDDTFVVFVTGQSKYAIDAFRVGAANFMLKPLTYADFLKGVARVKHQKDLHDAFRSARKPDSVFVKSDYRLVQLKYDDILYVEGQKDYVRFCIKGDGEEREVVSLLNMKAVESSLPSARFIRIHRSYIVNTSEITVIDRNRLKFGEKYLPVSEKYRPLLYQYIKTRSIVGNTVTSDE